MDTRTFGNTEKGEKSWTWCLLLPEFLPEYFFPSQTDSWDKQILSVSPWFLLKVPLSLELASCVCFLIVPEFICLPSQDVCVFSDFVRFRRHNHVSALVYGVFADPFFSSMCSFTLFTCQENSLFRTLIATESAHIRNVVTGSMHSQYVIFDVSLLSLILTGLQCKHLRHSPSGHLQSIIMV